MESAVEMMEIDMDEPLEKTEVQFLSEIEELNIQNKEAGQVMEKEITISPMVEDSMH